MEKMEPMLVFGWLLGYQVNPIGEPLKFQPAEIRTGPSTRKMAAAFSGSWGARRGNSKNHSAGTSKMAPLWYLGTALAWYYVITHQIAITHIGSVIIWNSMGGLHLITLCVWWITCWCCTLISKPQLTKCAVDGAFLLPLGWSLWFCMVSLIVYVELHPSQMEQSHQLENVHKLRMIVVPPTQLFLATGV